MNKDWIDIEEYLAVTEYNKSLEKENWDRVGRENNLRAEQNRKEHEKLVNSFSEEDYQKMQTVKEIFLKDGYEFYTPDYFRKMDGEIDIALNYNPRKDLFTVTTCKCHIECCGKFAGECKLEDINSTIEDFYKDE